MLGPDDGRYMLRSRDGEPVRIIVLATLGAPERRRLRRRRPRPAHEEAPASVSTTRVTLASAPPLPSSTQAAQWLSRMRSSRDACAAEVADGVRDLNEVLRAHRIAAADPYVRDVHAAQAIAVRLGYATGDQVARGRSDASYEVLADQPRRTRRRRAAPEERIAGVLRLRDDAGVAEELLLRARADLDADRPREAALQCRIALEALLADRAGLPAERVRALEQQRAEVSEAANRALSGRPSEELNRSVAEAVREMARSLRAREPT